MRTDVTEYPKMDEADSHKLVKTDTSIGLNKLNPDDMLEAKDFMLLQRVVRRMNSILDTGELLKQIVRDVSETLGFPRCAVLLYHEDTDQLEIAALTGWDDDNFYPGMRVERDEGIVWKVVREQRIIYIPDILDYPEEIPCAFTSRSHIDIPMYHHGKFIGALNAQNEKVNAFSIRDLRLLETLAANISIAIVNSRLFESERKEKEIILNELKEAKLIQSGFFPQKSPQIQDFRINGMCEPSYEVGGDWYDYIELPNGKIGVVLADVSGKGLPAAFLMSSARTIFRVIAATEQSPSNVLKKVNDYLIEDLPFTRFITLIYLIIDPKTGQIVMSNAGHMWPMQKSRNSVNQIKHDPSFPLGIQKDDYVDYNISLEKGEKLILYSDGVSEAANSKEQFFDDTHILASLNKPDGGMELIYKDLKIFTGSAPQNDDITMVEIERV